MAIFVMPYLALSKITRSHMCRKERAKLAFNRVGTLLFRCLIIHTRIRSPRGTHLDLRSIQSIFMAYRLMLFWQQEENLLIDWYAPVCLRDIYC